MPEHPTRGPNRRGIAAAVLVPAAAFAAIFTASSMATGTTNAASPAQQPTEPLPTEFSPPGTTGPGAPGGGTGTGTATRSPTPTRTATPTGTGTGVVPGVPTGTTVTCITGTGTPTRTGTGVVPGSPTGTRTTSPTRTATTAPTRPTGQTGTAPAPTGTPAPGGTAPSVVPGAAEQPQTGTPTGTHTTPGAVATTLRLGDAGGKSNVLVDEDGCALYLNTRDTGDSTAVDPGQESTWIPVPAPARVDSPGLDQAKVGTFTRPDGERQATFNGHQLYRFAGDRAPGEAKGQGVDDQFFLVGQNGDAVR